MVEASDERKRLVEKIIGNAIDEVEKHKSENIIVDVLDDDNSISIILIFPECEVKSISK